MPLGDVLHTVLFCHYKRRIDMWPIGVIFSLLIIYVMYNLVLDYKYGQYR